MGKATENMCIFLEFWKLLAIVCFQNPPRGKEASLMHKWANNFWLNDVTDKLQTFLESCVLQNFKTVHNFAAE